MNDLRDVAVTILDPENRPRPAATIPQMPHMGGSLAAAPAAQPDAAGPRPATLPTVANSTLT